MRRCRDHDDYPKRLYTPVKTIRSYCDEHRKLFQKSSFREYRSENEKQYEFTEDESLVNSLESSASRRSLLERRNRVGVVESPTTSCLKSVTSTKRTKVEKRVNFVEPDTYVSASQSSCHESPTQNATAIVRRPYANTSARLAQSCNRTITDYEEETSEIMQSSTSGLERLSLSSSTCCSPRPRIVKPKDVLKRPATRKLLIYPPEGQRGEPMTLRKKWSKIECRVNGDEDSGFRYKVYYVQTFESDKWFPNSKTNSPFRNLDDAEASTDYGN